MASRTSDTSESEPEQLVPAESPFPKTKRKSRAVPQPPDPLEGVKTAAPKKRQQSEKQKENFQKALSALKARREAQKKAQEEEAEALKAEKDELKLQAIQRERLEKAKYQKKKLPPPSERPLYITAAELQKFKLEMLDMVKPQKIVKEKEVEVEKIVEKPIVVEKIVEKPTTKIISGNDLLDRIFFK
jgi:hypothetical protein